MFNKGEMNKKSEEKLISGEKKYKEILENIREGYYEVDLRGNFTFFNKSLCKTLGYSPSELLGMNNRDYMDKDTAKKVFTRFNTVFISGTSVDDFEFNITTKDGRTLHIQSSVSLLFSPDAKPIGYSGIAKNITKRKLTEKKLDENRKNLHSTWLATIMGLAKLAEHRDIDAGPHLERIGEFSKIITEELSRDKKYADLITPFYIDNIYHSAILHDIGKVGIPDAVIMKPGKLTDDEFEIIQEHAALGGDAIKEIRSRIKGESFLNLAEEIADFHHEKWNGTGYPNGLKGDRIPLSARIVALADVYDALTSEKIYKDSFSHSKAVEIIKADSGHHFDPDIVTVFIARNKDFAKICKKMPDPMF